MVGDYFCLLGDVAFSEYLFCTTAVFSLYGEHAVRSFLPDQVLHFLHHQLIYVRIQLIKTPAFPSETS